MQSGGDDATRNMNGVGVPAGVNPYGGTHEFSGTIDLSGMLYKETDDGDYYYGSDDDGYVKLEAASNVAINDKYIVIGLQAHNLVGGVVYYMAADRGGQWLLYQPEL